MHSILTLAAANNLTLWELIRKASGVVTVVMLLLAAMSVVGWYIIGYKYWFLRRATNVFLDAFWRKDIQQIHVVAQQRRWSPLAHMFLAGYSELSKLQKDGDRQDDLESIERALAKAQVNETTRLESMVPFLATTGSAAPFIGLFGTVWGIMNSFRAIGAMKTASVANVAPGIAEALIATAIGLVAAIPAVMAYNFFVRKIKLQTSEMESFTKDFLNIVRRHFLK
jgi:biopolymer transport protein TolQ